MEAWKEIELDSYIEEFTYVLKGLHKKNILMSTQRSTAATELVKLLHTTKHEEETPEEE